MAVAFLSAQGWPEVSGTTPEAHALSAATPTPTSIPAHAFVVVGYAHQDGATYISALSDSNGAADTWSAPAGNHLGTSSDGTVGIALGQIGATGLSSSGGSITATYSSNAYQYRQMSALAFSGVAASSPQDGSSETMAATYTNAATLGTALSYSAGDLVVGVFYQYQTDNQVLTPAAGLSVFSTVESSRRCDIVYGVMSTAGSITAFGTYAAYVSAMGIASAFKAASTGVTHTDSATGSIPVAGSGVESYVPPGTTYTDTGSGSITVSGSGVDLWIGPAIVHDDTATGAVTVTGSGQDAAAHTDARSGALAVTGSSTDSLIRSTAGSGAVSIAGAAAGSQTHTSTGAGQVVLTGAAVESHQTAGTDTGTGSITITGAGIGSQTHMSQGAGSIAVSGTSSETHSVTYTDARSGVASLTGAGSDAATHSATNSGIVSLTGTGVESYETAGDDTGTGIVTVRGSGVGSQTHTSTGAGSISVSGTSAVSHSVTYTDAGSGVLTIAGSGTSWLPGFVTVSDRLLMGATVADHAAWTAVAADQEA